MSDVAQRIGMQTTIKGLAPLEEGYRLWDLPKTCHLHVIRELVSAENLAQLSVENHQSRH